MVPGTLCQSWQQVSEPDAKQAVSCWAKKRQSTGAGGPRAFVVLPTFLASRQRLGDVNSRTRLAWPYLSPRSAVSRVGVTRHTHLNLSSVGALLRTSPAPWLGRPVAVCLPRHRGSAGPWLCISPGTVALQGRWLARAGVGCVGVAGRSEDMEEHAAGVDTVRNQRSVPTSP